ncbi:hypothetical protein DL770_000514 [Monosporascus sp. CRB-9-2]|nr:hypothetical protein DL770_000514 [Monosporascus sp. CRB-9-2]
MAVAVAAAGPNGAADTYGSQEGIRAHTTPGEPASTKDESAPNNQEDEPAPALGEPTHHTGRLEPGGEPAPTARRDEAITVDG